MPEPVAGGALQKSVYKNFAKFTGKHLWQSLLFNKVARISATSETKPHESFPTKQFHSTGYNTRAKTYRNTRGGVLTELALHL